MVYQVGIRCGVPIISIQLRWVKCEVLLWVNLLNVLSAKVASLDVVTSTPRILMEERSSVMPVDGLLYREQL